MTPPRPFWRTIAANSARRLATSFGVTLAFLASLQLPDYVVLIAR